MMTEKNNERMSRSRPEEKGKEKSKASQYKNDLKRGGTRTAERNPVTLTVERENKRVG